MFTAVIVTAAITALVAFPAGVLFHSRVVSESASIKAHVTAEVTATEQRIEKVFDSVRGELKTAVEKFGQKL